MAQIDVTRNYYADLGVSAAADESEIRKAYRKLALQYHPDRNRGREVETTTKFQEIQAAMDILGNAKLRATYDQKRKAARANVPSYSGFTQTRPQPARSAYTTANARPYYRASDPRPPPPQQHHSTFANGAERFTSKNFRTPPTAQRPSPRRQEGEKADFSSAWAKMKQPRAEERTKPASASNPNNPNGTPFGRSKSARTPSKTGFNPATPGGDEGQARSSYRSTHKHPEAPPPPADDFEDVTYGSNKDVPYTEGTRTRTPYATRAGERTSMYGEGTRQSASSRSSPLNRPRSATDGAYNRSPQAAAGEAKPKPQPQAPRWSGAVPPKAPKPTRTFAMPTYSSSSDSSDEEEADIFKGRSKNPRAAAPPPPPPPAPQPPKAAPPNPPNLFAQFGAPPYQHKPFQSKSDESINATASGWQGKFDNKHEILPDHFAFFAKPNNTQRRPTAKARTSPTRGRSAQRAPTQKEQSTEFKPQAGPSIFAFGGSQHMPPPPPLNTQAASASANGTSSAPQSAGFASPNFPTGNIFAQSQAKSQAWDQSWGFRAAPAASGPSEPVKFAPETWSSTFQSANWAMPQTTNKPKESSTSPRRGSRPKANIRKASAVPNTSTKSENSEEEPTAKQSKFQATVEDATNGLDDIMDIDIDTPPAAAAKPEPVKVDADFRFKSGIPIQFSPPKPKEAPQAQAHGQSESQTQPQPQTSPPAGPAPARKNTNANANASTSNTSPGLDGLNNLRNVEPLHPSTNGEPLAGGLNDLGDTLPFPSRATNLHPLKPQEPKDLHPTKVPSAPEPPAKLDAASVAAYLTQMDIYVRRFCEWDKTLLAHFSARDAELARLQANLCTVRGETADKVGFASYARKRREDLKVREAWQAGHMRHLRALERCEEVRNWGWKMGSMYAS